jgi:hypothetical protein
VERGGSLRFSAKVDGQNLSSENQRVVWSVAGASGAGTGIDENGLLTVDADETGNAGILTVTAKSVYDESVSATVPVTLTAVPVTFIGISASDTNGTTTKLVFYFSRNIQGLTESHIAVTTAAGHPVATGTLEEKAVPGLYELPLSGAAMTGTLTATVNGVAGYTVTPSEQTVLVHYLNAVPASIKEKFGILATGTDGVQDTFNMLHDFIRGGGLTNLPGVIKLGDWIDLEDGLHIASGYNTAAVDYNTNPSITGKGALLRLIVVGINSFNGKNENNIPHLVFHFQNLPLQRRMEATVTNGNGYQNSEMRGYLENTFLPGLIAAGVPENVLWKPRRYVSAKGSNANGAHFVEDNLWLPTEREMFNANTNSSATWEKAENQAWLAYYDSPEKRKKYTATGTAQPYWEASPWSAHTYGFCQVTSAGEAGTDGESSTEDGCVPAFCVW